MKRKRRDWGTTTQAAASKKRKVNGGQYATTVSRVQKAPLRTGGYLSLYSGYGQPKRSNMELKAKDTAASLVFTSDTGNILLLNGIALGTDFNTRIGRKFTMKSILMRLSVFQGDTTPPRVANARVMIVYDSQTNTTAPTIAQVLNTTIGSPVVRCNNLDNRDRFKVLLDYTCSISPNGQQCVFEKKYLRCDLETINGGTDATVGSITTGSLYLLCIGDNVAADPNPNPKGEVFVRVRYSDA